MRLGIKSALLLLVLFSASPSNAAQEISWKGRAFIKGWEGFSLCPYQDVAGYWTVGVGHLMKSSESKTQCISPTQVEELFSQDVIPTKVCIRTYLSDTLEQNQFDALTSFTFNLGCRKDSTLFRVVNNNPADPQVGTEFLRWTKAGGKEVRGLRFRREAEKRLYYSNW